MDLNSDWTVKGAYARGVHLIDFADGTGTRWQYSVNRHGDVSAMVNSVTGEDIGYEYDAYGNQSDITAADTNPFRYSGEYFDSETGLIYLRARYYDSAIGRFISEDPVRDGTNWFVYCANNPVILYDPSGMMLLGNDRLGKAAGSADHGTPCPVLISSALRRYAIPIVIPSPMQRRAFF